MNDIKTILVTTDFSETAKKAFGPAEMLARKFGARLVLVCVEPDRLPPIVVEYASTGLNDILAEQRERTKIRLSKTASDEFGPDLEIETLVGDGTPHIEIIRLAEQKKADLVVMATHGHGFISHAILGSTTERVVRRSPCPVFVVRDCAKESHVE
jgi:nucleotide-binding universal stress UspA family protein